MILGKWTAKNVIMNELNYNNGNYNQSHWNITLNFLSNINNNQYITQIMFENLNDKSQNGFEFSLFNYDIKKNSINGIDSNSMYDGYIEDDVLYITSRGLGNIKFPKQKVLNSFNCKFTKSLH